MPPSEKPDHTVMNGTRKNAIGERVVAPTTVAPGSSRIQAPGGGVGISVAGRTLRVPSARRAEMANASPQAGQKARSVAMLIWSAGGAVAQRGQVIRMPR